MSLVLSYLFGEELRGLDASFTLAVLGAATLVLYFDLTQLLLSPVLLLQFFLTIKEIIA